MQPKKDRIFVIVMGLVLVNLIFLFAEAVSSAISYKSLVPFFWIFTDGVAIIGVLYLLRSYKRARKIAKLEQEKLSDDINKKDI